MFGTVIGGLKAVRAHGLLASSAAVVIGTSVAVSLTGDLNVGAALLTAVVAFSLHISMNVYNDIHDTRQGSDTLESAKGLFSGGSGTLVARPDLEPLMVLIARAGIIIGALGALGLLSVTDRPYHPIIIAIFVLAAMLSRFYSGPPFKLAYRGFGEVFVFLAFGPMAVGLAAAAQGALFDIRVFAVMPITGLSTLMLAWTGQMVDLPFDEVAGKRGMVMMLGLPLSVKLLGIMQAALMINILIVSTLFPQGIVLVLASFPFLVTSLISFTELSGSVAQGGTVRKGTTVNFIGLVILSLALMTAFVAMTFFL